MPLVSDYRHPCSLSLGKRRKSLEWDASCLSSIRRPWKDTATTWSWEQRYLTPKRLAISIGSLDSHGLFEAPETIEGTIAGQTALTGLPLKFTASEDVMALKADMPALAAGLVLAMAIVLQKRLHDVLEGASGNHQNQMLESKTWNTAKVN